MNLYVPPIPAPGRDARQIVRAVLQPDDPFLPPLPPEPPCECGHDRLYHNDRFDDRIADLAIGGGPCQQCACAGYREPRVDDDIAAVRAEMAAECEWSTP